MKHALTDWLAALLLAALTLEVYALLWLLQP